MSVNVNLHTRNAVQSSQESRCMLQPFRKLVLLLALLTVGGALALVLAVGALRANGDDADLRAFLVPPEGCAIPCWQGIQPGVTTQAQAIAILEVHPWVKRVSAGQPASSTRIYWQWNDDTPDFANDRAVGVPTSYLAVQDGIIRYIRLSTHLSYGAVRSLLGVPGSGTFIISNPNSAKSVYKHTAGYFGGLLVFDTEVACPVSLSAFWNAPVIMTYSDGSYPSLLTMPAYHLSEWVYQAPCKS